jgi:phosphate starvation-inducible membrane PsiE
MCKKENRTEKIENRTEKKENRVKNIENRTKSSLTLILVFLFTVFYSLNSSAQCAMCRAVLETEEGSIKAEAVNDGLVYLMAFPYILVGIIGYIVYRSRLPKAG